MKTKAFLRKWIEALRSGKYKQGNHTLRQEISEGEYTYCCLGVAVDIHPEACLVTDSQAFFQDQTELEGGLLPKAMTRAIGLTHEQVMSLAFEWNDQGKSFKQIATHIEKTILKEKVK